MKGINFLETSKVAGLGRRYNEAYKDSWSKKTSEKLINQAKTCFRYSFLGKITEIGEEENTEILHNSKAARWTANSYNILKNRIANYALSSIIMNSGLEVKKELYSLPVKTGGMIIFTAILSSMLLYFFLRKEIGMLGWVIRAALLFAAFWGMFCEISWEELKKTSWFIRHIEARIQKG
jgi:hypothetical protein